MLVNAENLETVLEALIFAFDRMQTNLSVKTETLETAMGAIVSSSIEFKKPVNLFQKLKNKCKNLKDEAVEVYRSFLEGIKEEFTMLFNLYLNVRNLLKNEFEQLKNLLNSGIIDIDNIRKNRYRRMPIIRYLRRVRDILYKCIGYIETEINKLPKEDKKNTTCPVQIELLAELGFFDLEKVKECSKKKLSQILSKILNKNEDSIRNNIRALNPDVSNYDISKYTVGRPDTTSRVRDILGA